MPLTPAQQAVKDGDPAAALKLLQDQVRAKPQDAALRVFLFQLLCVLGQWERALTQLKVAAELDAATLPMVQTYQELVQCERLRNAVLQGRKAPMIFGEPQPWLALLIEALLREGRGEYDAGRQLREQALQDCPATAGNANGAAFQWIADADTRLGPVLEAVINGRYYWLPLSRLDRVTIEAPADLRDTVWMPAQFQFANGGEAVGFIPSRYPGSEAGEPAHQLARRTDWSEPRPGHFVGLGQRVLHTDAGEHALLDLRTIELDGSEA